MGIVSAKLRASAKGQRCTFQIPGVCNHDPETTVLAHLRSDVAGRGTKSDDWHAAFACSACHACYDQHKMSGFEELWHGHIALQRTYKIWWAMGLITIAGDTEKPRKPSAKIVPGRPIYSVKQE